MDHSSNYHYCPADATGQHFVCQVPETYDPKTSYPLIVDIHGSGGRPMAGPGKVTETRFITVKPWGRGDTSYYGLGEYDVMEIIRHMKRWYNIDGNRVYLRGHSMGGNGSWVLGSKYPDIFASTCPKAGRADKIHFENLRHVPVFKANVPRRRPRVDRLDHQRHWPTMDRHQGRARHFRRGCSEGTRQES